MKNLIYFTLFIALNAWGDPLLVDFKLIAGKPLEQVEKIIGNPESCSKSYVENVNYCLFKGGAIDIFFVNDVSDWITISTFEKYPYSIESITYLGLTPLPNSEPTAKLGWLTHFEPYLNYRSVMLGQGKSGLLSYISIKVNTLNFGVFTPLPKDESESKVETPSEIKALEAEIKKLKNKLN